MQWLMQTLPKTDTGYLLFNLGSHGIASAIMLPATFCAGMTLPLITNILFRQGHGEKSVGAVYAANTVGAIIGVLGAVHLGLPLLGLKGLMVCGVTLDMALGVMLIWSAGAHYQKRRQPALITISCVAVIAMVIAFVKLDPFKMASGVYRTVELLNAKKHSLLFHRDGKTSTVSVAMGWDGITSIRNNGKSDSSIYLNPDGPVSVDEPTTVLLGALPLIFKPDARIVANIGLGTGLTTQTLLSNPNIERVDTIEIEPAVIEGARFFRSRSGLAFSDPRSRIIIDDAKSVFSSYGQKYDIIISEPSNPWVSGVASLFTEEFYRHVNRYLRDDGLYVQWLQLYEMDINLVVSALKAISGSFADYSVYHTANADLMVVAKKKGRLGAPKPDLWKIPAMRSILSRISVNGLQDIRIREVGAKDYLDPLLNNYSIRANSDYYPVLDQLASKAMFMGIGATSILRLATSPIPYMHLAPATQSPPLSMVTADPACEMSLLARRAVFVRDYLLRGKSDYESYDEKIMSPPASTYAINLRRMMQNCRSFPETARKDYLFYSAVAMVPYLTAAELEPIWNSLYTGSCRATMTSLEKEYLGFFRALGQRDFKTVANLGRQLLATDRDISRNTRIYLTATGMLASLANGDRTQSLWFYRQSFDESEQQDLSLQLLLALSK
jgi:spermidine synthase